jgi:hypothetical protein
MNMMLYVLFGSIVVGLFSHRLGRRETAVVVAIATALTAIYYVRPLTMT